MTIFRANRRHRKVLKLHYRMKLIRVADPHQTGGDLASTRVTELEVHAERVVTLVKQSLQLDIVANDENYALAA